jgi:hypothetical protein
MGIFVDEVVVHGASVSVDSPRSSDVRASRREYMKALHERKQVWQPIMVRYSGGQVGAMMDLGDTPLLGGQVVDARFEGLERLAALLAPTLEQALQMEARQLTEGSNKQVPVWVLVPRQFLHATESPTEPGDSSCTDELIHLLETQVPGCTDRFDIQMRWVDSADLHEVFAEVWPAIEQHARARAEVERRYRGWKIPESEVVPPFRAWLFVVDSWLETERLLPYVMAGGLAGHPPLGEVAVGIALSTEATDHTLAELVEAAHASSPQRAVELALQGAAKSRPHDPSSNIWASGHYDQSHNLCTSGDVLHLALDAFSLGAANIVASSRGANAPHVHWRRFCPNLSVGHLGIASGAFALAHAAYALHDGWSLSGALLLLCLTEPLGTELVEAGATAFALQRVGSQTPTTQPTTQSRR